MVSVHVRMFSLSVSCTQHYTFKLDPVKLGSRTKIEANGILAFYACFRLYLFK